MAADPPVGQQSILGHWKLVCLERHAEDLIRRNVPGDIAEVGVYRGGSARLLCLTFSDREVYLFDTFAGMPFADEGDVHLPGDFADTSFESVSELLSDCPNAHLRAGLFPETTEGLEDHIFAFVHVDGDQYRTTLDSLEFFYPKLPPGGVMVFDDYEWVNCPGVKKALGEFLEDKPEQIIPLGNHQALLVRL